MSILRLLNFQHLMFQKSLKSVKFHPPPVVFTAGSLPQGLQRKIHSPYLGEQTRRYKSTNTASASAKPVVVPDTLDLTFTDGRQAYRSKSTWEVLRAYIVYKLCAVNMLVENNQKLMKMGQAILGQTLFEKMMKATFYGHFVAGTDEVNIQPNIHRLKEFGVKAILDYSVEEDITEDDADSGSSTNVPPTDASSNTGTDKDLHQYKPHKEFANRRKKAQVRTYFYLNEAQCEKNMAIFLNSIEAVSDTTESTGFAAIKITALGRPQLLLHLSEAIARVQTYVGTITGKRGTIVEQGVDPDLLKRRLEKAAKMDPTVQSWLDNMTYDKSGLIHVLPWHGLVEAQKGISESLKVPNLSTGKLQNLMPPLPKQEDEMFKNMMKRLHTIFQVASKAGVRVMVDAEQTYYQPAISRITMEMMRKYNKEKAIVFNTYQCYLKKAFRYLSADMTPAERLNFHFGAKLVRGAYMEQERQRAAGIGYEDPINPTLEATTEMYHKCFEEGMIRMRRFKETGQHLKIHLMAATHNEDTVKFVVNKMKEYDIKQTDRLISFGQLYGMCDQVSFPLALSGYSVYKYVPYGPVAEVLPYLSRRAQENGGMMGEKTKEVKLLRNEFLRRVFKGKLFYRPKGPFPVT